MSSLFSPHHRIVLFRKLWIALASAQKKLGLNITDKQLKEMRAHVEDISFEKAKDYEKRFRHDVMAHIHAFGDQCPSAKPILHLGATSTYVTDNADLIQMKDGLRLLLQKINLAIRALSDFAKKHAGMPCLGFTHYQPAQPTTVGKRACLWLQDLLTDALEWERLHLELPFLGAKGATGTQASFLALFDGNEKKVLELEKLIAKEFDFTAIIPICGQTYPRKIDVTIHQALASFAASIHKMATDLRLLAHDQEILEGRLKSQVGSSAMPYKRNPMHSERLCGLSRFVLSLAQNSLATLSVQWLERSLDDSSNRRLTIPEAFLAVDSILNILVPLIQNLEVNSAAIHANLEKHLADMAQENLLMETVKKGGDRQKMHEKLRTESQKKKPTRSKEEIHHLIGRAPEQTQEFLQGPIALFLKRHPKASVSLPPLEL
jgi:adenylosuccinate lyase